MRHLHATRALTPTGWMHNVEIGIEDGRISTLRSGCAAGDHVCLDTLLPALGNLHSHTFQRAMAGMTEARAAGRESFWTWRTLMYQFMDHITPEQYQAIAALVFMEMLEAGYASVGEFHYVHHQPGGARYDSPGELSNCVFAAAQTTGIGLTHLPVLYSYGGPGKAPLAAGQARFGNSVDAFAALVADIRTTVERDMPADTKIGIAPHSLRATSPDDLAAVMALRTGGPVHIHIAEQPKEVADIEAWLGARPVEWLLANTDVTPDWCLIHATHMTSSETADMARSGAVAGLCPITEANLGDGPFNGAAYLADNGAFGIGSDSNVRIALGEELRMLEYSQRLRDLARTVLVRGEGSVGAALYLGAAKGGAQALARDAGRIEIGALADLVAIDSTHPALCALDEKQLLDGLCFAAGNNVVTDVWSAGRHCVQDGRHVNRAALIGEYKSAVASL